MRTKPVERCGAGATGFRAGSTFVFRGRIWRSTSASRILTVSFLFASVLLVLAPPGNAFSQEPQAVPASTLSSPDSATPTSASLAANAPVAAVGFITQWEGLPVRSISFEGVTADQLEPLAGHLPATEGKALTEDDLKRSLRRLYGTGLYDTIEVRAGRTSDGVALTFAGVPRTFIGTVSVDGAAGSTTNMQLERSSQLEPGTRLTQEKMQRALAQMRSTLEQNGYYEAAIEQKMTPHPRQQLTDIAFHVASGPRAHVGKVAIMGDAGMTLEEFRRHAGLWKIAHVDRDTVNRALDGVSRAYQKQDRLEAEVKLES
ncbi:MAG: POTRA domain-containing protein, partial [Terracidiphilus sp.]